MQQKILISAIIVTYKSQDLIEECINSIINNCDIEKNLVEIIVIDNSPFKEAKIIKSIIENKYNYNILYHKSTGNLGYGKGNNTGLNISKGDLILIINPDVRLNQPIFKKSLDHFNKNSNLSIIGYKQLGGNNLSFFSYPQYDIPLISSILTLLLNKINIYSKSYYFLSGALLLIRKENFSNYIFDENIFMYYEDVDLGMRIKKSGRDSIFIKDLTYTHLINKNERLSRGEESIESEHISAKYYLSKYRFSWKIFCLKRLIDHTIKFAIYKSTKKQINSRHHLDMAKKFLKIIN